MEHACRDAQAKRDRQQKRKEDREAKKKRKVMQRGDGDNAEKKKESIMAVQVLTKIVDPLRRALSCAQELLFEGTVDGPRQLEPVRHCMPECKHSIVVWGAA